MNFFKSQHAMKVYKDKLYFSFHLSFSEKGSFMLFYAVPLRKRGVNVTHLKN